MWVRWSEWRDKTPIGANVKNWYIKYNDGKAFENGFKIFDEKNKEVYKYIPNKNDMPKDLYDEDDTQKEEQPKPVEKVIEKPVEKTLTKAMDKIVEKAVEKADSKGADAKVKLKLICEDYHIAKPSELVAAFGITTAEMLNEYTSNENEKCSILEAMAYLYSKISKQINLAGSAFNQFFAKLEFTNKQIVEMFDMSEEDIQKKIVEKTNT